MASKAPGGAAEALAAGCLPPALAFRVLQALSVSLSKRRSAMTDTWHACTECAAHLTFVPVSPALPVGWLVAENVSALADVCNADSGSPNSCQDTALQPRVLLLRMRPRPHGEGPLLIRASFLEGLVTGPDTSSFKVSRLLAFSTLRQTTEAVERERSRDLAQVISLLGAGASMRARPW